jgi:hypothetical protein
MLLAQPPAPEAREHALAPAWTVGPDQSWFQTPISSHQTAGHSLLDQPTLQLRGHKPLKPSASYKFDAWSSPFTMCYLNVGRHHLIGSLPAVVALIQQHRPDILFLGDLVRVVTSRNHIQGILVTSQSGLPATLTMSGLSPPTLALSHRPVGIGALVHCTLANHVTDCLVPALHDRDKAEWEAATGGSILRLQVTRPGLSSPWEYIGVYQHVAKAANRSARALLRETLGSILKIAKDEQCAQAGRSSARHLT